MLRLVLSITIITTCWSLHPAPAEASGPLSPSEATRPISASEVSLPDTANPHNPALQSFWASHPTGSTLSPDMARNMLDSPLSVIGKGGSAYTITRFQFSYKERTQYKDDSTGEIKTTYHLYTRNYFNTASIDSLWKSNIGSSLQSGETIFVDHIIVMDAQGKKSMAPELELNIQ
jgi:hypothetical protein